ncbi:hypothetical protein A1507_20605 [Methylomonas koyamae]|uniref:Uncharacterized protein n=1 Tax=Methylomonas koyamae TaxID=702114 RepID=A0A177N1R5_9GAMM|nr:hypothetical protein A1507_20605 [Methylomonas koyamae]
MSARSDGRRDENNERHRRSCRLNSAVRQRRYPLETGAAMVTRGACCLNYWAEEAKTEAPLENVRRQPKACMPTRRMRRG